MFLTRLSQRTTQTLSTRSFSIKSITMADNKYGQGTSHAQGQSQVPGKIQQKAPKGVEDALPDSVHDTGSGGKDSTSKSHAVDPDSSIVPKKLQEVLPESVERAVPNAIHDTGKK